MEDVIRRLDNLEKAIHNGKFILAEVYKIQIENIGHMIRDIQLDIQGLSHKVDLMATKDELQELRSVLRWGFRWMIGAVTSIAVAVVVFYITRVGA